MDLGLGGRVFILTGASKGLGYATAEALVADGAKVVVSARDAAAVSAAVERLGGHGSGGDAVGVPADLGDPEAPARLVAAATERFGRLDGALISVGGPARGSAASMSDEQWREAFDTVFVGSVRAARTFAGAMGDSAPGGSAPGGSAMGDGGAIALVLSTSVKTPLEALGLSNGLRPGLAMAAKDMSDEWGPRGIRVVSLLPGRFLTDRNRELFDATGDPEAAAAKVAATIPLRRIGEPADFGRVAAFVLSPAASYLTGIALPVDGGMLRTL